MLAKPAMRNNVSSSDKSSGYDTVTVELDDGRSIDAAHHIVNDRAQLLHLYIEERDGGIDVTVPLADSAATAWARTDVGREALGIDTDDDTDHELVADGGREVPPCECGADLGRTSELTTSDAPVAGARPPCPTMRTVPDAECRNCGRSVGAMFGTLTAVAVWEARGESPPVASDDDDGDDRRLTRFGAGDPPVFDDDDDDDDDSDGRLMTDGGTRYPQNKLPRGTSNPATDAACPDDIDRGEPIETANGGLLGHVLDVRAYEVCTQRSHAKGWYDPEPRVEVEYIKWNGETTVTLEPDRPCLLRCQHCGVLMRGIEAHDTVLVDSAEKEYKHRCQVDLPDAATRIGRRVEYRGEVFGVAMVYATAHGPRAALVPVTDGARASVCDGQTVSGVPAVEVVMYELARLSDADDDDDSDDRRLMTDGGRDVADAVEADDADEFGADDAVNMDALTEAIDDRETVENSDGVTVATSADLGALGRADGAKWECTACGSMHDTEHAAKTHFGSVGHTADDVKIDVGDDDAVDVDVVAAVEDHIDGDDKHYLDTDPFPVSRGRGQGTLAEDDVPDVDGVTVLVAKAHHSRHREVYAAVERGVDVSDVQRVIDVFPWDAQEPGLKSPCIVIGDRPSELHDEYREYREIDRVSQVMGVEQGGALRSAEPPVDLGSGLDADTAGDDGDDTDDDGDDEWADVRDNYDAASVGASPVSKADARDALVDLLQDMTEWLSIRERSDPGSSYDLWVWTDEHGFQSNGKAVIAELTAEHVGSRISDTEVNHITSQLARLNAVDQDATNARHLDRTLIPVENGVIDVDATDYDAETMTIDVESVELLDKEPGHRFLYQIETEWDPESADVEGLDSWLETITRSDEARRIIWEFAGHSLHPRYPEDGFMTALGPGGSGKSQTFEVIKQMLGSDNVAVQKLDDLQNNRFSAAHVVDKRANINTELTGTKLDSLDKLKVYAAGEEDAVEKKGQPFYQELNDATMMFASDDPPALPQDNKAVGRRLYPIEFPAQYVDDPDPDDPYELQYRSKTEVQAELQAEERLLAALVRAVDGLKRLLEEGDFTSSKSWKERVEQYESFADPVRDAARMCLEPAEDGAIESGDLELAFGAFFNAREHDGKSMQKIKTVLDEMPSLPVAKDRTRTFTPDSEKHIVYRGIKFTEEAKKAWVPHNAHWDQYGGRPGDDEDGDDDTQGWTAVSDVANGDVDGQKVDLKVTVDSAGMPRYNNDDGGTLEDVTGDIEYRVPTGSLSEDQTYVIMDALVREDKDGHTYVELFEGVTDWQEIDVDGDQSGLPDDDSDGDGAGDSDGTDGSDSNDDGDDPDGDGNDSGSDDGGSVGDLEAIDRAAKERTDRVDSEAALVGAVVKDVGADMETVQNRIDTLQERGDVILDEHRDMIDGEGDDSDKQNDDSDDGGDSNSDTNEELMAAVEYVIETVREFGEPALEEDVIELLRHDAPMIRPVQVPEVVDWMKDAGWLQNDGNGLRVAGGE